MAKAYIYMVSIINVKRSNIHQEMSREKSRTFTGPTNLKSCSASGITEMNRESIEITLFPQTIDENEAGAVRAAVGADG